MNPHSGLFCCRSQVMDFDLYPYPIDYAVSKVQLWENHLLWSSSHLTESVCQVSVQKHQEVLQPALLHPRFHCLPSRPTLTHTTLYPWIILLWERAVRCLYRSKHCFAWEMHWSSVACSRSLPELSCRSALPSHVPHWTRPNSLAWISGMTLDMPHFYGLIWRSLHTWLPLVMVTRPALAWVLWDWALVGVVTAPVHLVASPAPSLCTLVPQQRGALCL